MKFRWFLPVLVVIGCGSGSDSPDQLSGSQNPGHPYPRVVGSEARGERNFAHLINRYAEGKADPSPWAGFWWPYTANGIASGKFGSSSSPAGKYDAARGNSTKAQAWELKLHGSGVPKVQAWWGHCNGWSAAAALYKEPNEGVKVNGIEFGIADIKALLTEAAMSVDADFFGERIDVDDPSSKKYWDTVPDQYFLVLTNYMGALKKPILIDRYTGSQVWNQPLAGYRFDYPKPADYLGNTPEAPNVYRIIINSTIWWREDGVAPDVQTPAFNFEEVDTSGTTSSRTLKMELWLDGPVVFGSDGKIKSSGNVITTRDGDFIVGGAWQMGEGFLVDAWPDYMWIPYRIVRPTDPEQDYVNPEVDIEWLQAHILVPGGADDNSVPGDRVVPAPNPTSGPSSFPNDPFPMPTPPSTSRPDPWPMPTPPSSPSDPYPAPPPRDPNPFPGSRDPNPWGPGPAPGGGSGDSGGSGGSGPGFPNPFPPLF